MKRSNEGGQPRRCGRGHDLSVEANIVRHAGRKPECRICKAMTNARYAMRQVVHHTCEDCGLPKHPDKRRTCGPCRWRRAQAIKLENPRGAVLRQTIDELVALECEPPWVRDAARKERERADAEMRAALRSVVTESRPT